MIVLEKIPVTSAVFPEKQSCRWVRCAAALPPTFLVMVLACPSHRISGLVGRVVGSRAWVGYKGCAILYSYFHQDRQIYVRKRVVYRWSLDCLAVPVTPVAGVAWNNAVVIS